MSRQRSKLIANLWRAADVTITGAAFGVAFFLKKYTLPGDLGGLTDAPNYSFVLLLGLVIFSLSYSFFRFYEPFRKESVEAIVVMVVKAASVGIALLVFSLYLLKIQNISRILLGFFVIFDILFILAARIAAHLFPVVFRRKHSDYRAVLVVGSGKRAAEVAAIVRETPGSGCRMVGYIAIDEREDGLPAASRPPTFLGRLSDFRDVLMNNAVDEVIFASPLAQIEGARSHISFAEELGVDVHILLDWQLRKIMYQPETASVLFDKFLGLPSIVLSSTPQNGGDLLVKSFVDYVGAALGLIILSPLMIVIVAAIKATSKGPVLYRQERCGINGRTFSMFKFRTMVANADRIQESLEGINEMDGPVFKSGKDPRITPFGGFLRRMSLDELPQLFNIIRGEMSFVGPRPPIPGEVEKYEPWQRRRLSMKPGLTCTWQVNGRNKVLFEKWMRMDLEYIDNWSLSGDFKIILKTIPAVLLGTGK